jgi:uncharacterized protein (DUF1015 family)
VHFNPQSLPDLGRVLAPPYDVLSPQDRADLEARSPYNVVRLLLGELAWDHSPSVDKYQECARLWREWQDQGVMVRDDKPAFYLYRQRFLSEGDSYTRLGLIALVKLEPYSAGVVLPHEQTFPKAKEDRYRLLSACGANFDSIYGLYDDPEGKVRSALTAMEKSAPVLKASLDGQEQALWPITDPAVQEVLSRELADTVITIADGHHRYETALKYRDDQGAADDPTRPEAWVMMTLSSIQDPGLVVLPTHRLVEVTYDGREPNLAQTIATVREVANKRFDVQEAGPVPHLLSRMCEYARRGQGALGVYFGESTGEVIPPGHQTEGPFANSTSHDFGDSLSFVLRCKDGGGEARATDILRLHREILDKLQDALGAVRITVTYTHSVGEAVGQVRAGNCQMAFLLNPVPVEEVYRTAQAGKKMPEKSTYFYPKLTSGVVLRPLDE